MSLSDAIFKMSECVVVLKTSERDIIVKMSAGWKAAVES